MPDLQISGIIFSRTRFTPEATEKKSWKSCEIIVNFHDAGDYVNGGKVISSDSIFRAFGYRNYRLFWTGQAVSLIGSWMQRVAMAWLVYKLSRSPFMLGLVEFAGQMPAFLLAPVAGVYLDRWNRLRILLITQILLMLQALLLSILVLGEWITIWQLFLLNISFGLINAFDQPARQAILHDIIERKEDIGNAIALNSSMFNGARLVGPSIAGFVIAFVGEGWCFLINAFTFITIIAALLFIRTRQVAPLDGQLPIWASMNEGWRYAYRTFPIRTILVLLTWVSLIGNPYSVLLPVLAKDVFHGDARVLGFLTASTGIGALYGAYHLARRRSVLGLEKLMLAAVLSTAFAFVLIYVWQIYWLALIFFIFVGFGLMSVYSSGNTMLQSIAAEDKRGRVISLYTMTFQGMTPVGCLLAGIIAKHWGAPATFLTSGLLLILSAAIYTLFIPRMQQHIWHFYSDSKNHE